MASTSTTTPTVLTTTREDLALVLPLIGAGKVRDLYESDESSLLFVATDRVSAYDVVLNNGIPDKGRVLTQMSRFWFDKLPTLVTDSGNGSPLKTHFLSLGLPEQLLEGGADQNAKLVKRYQDRSMLVKNLKMLPIESIVRGYITGSAWSEYQKTGTVHGIVMKEGLQESEILDQPLWTPSTKAEAGESDENITPEQAVKILGQDIADQVATLSITIYKAARDYATTRGIIIADTKFEFGLDESVSPPRVVLADEVLTPDSSRFWDQKAYQVGKPQNSLDKQVLRDWLVANKLKGVPDVTIPDEVVARTHDGYVHAYFRLTGDNTFGTGEQ